jgi:hypothetical protein
VCPTLGGQGRGKLGDRCRLSPSLWSASQLTRLESRALAVDGRGGDWRHHGHTRRATGCREGLALAPPRQFPRGCRPRATTRQRVEYSTVPVHIHTHALRTYPQVQTQPRAPRHGDVRPRVSAGCSGAREDYRFQAPETGHSQRSAAQPKPHVRPWGNWLPGSFIKCRVQQAQD